MSQARLKYKNLKVKKQKLKIVPMGIWFQEIKRAPFHQVKKHSLVFIGHLTKKQGLQLVIQTVPEIIKKIPDFELVIFGQGEYQKTLKKLVKTKGLESKVKFRGHIKNLQKMQTLISQSACAIAPYSKGSLQSNFTYYADPGKIKDYLAAGLPIILTPVPHNASQLQKAGCAIVCNYQTKALAKGVIKKYRQNALNFAQQYDWPKIYSRAIKNYSLGTI
jgi:glycosyltransferase involved in cell wall biosynthesis